MSAGNDDSTSGEIPEVSRILRITIFVSSLGGGGAERVATRLAEWMADAGHQVQLLSLSDVQSDFYTTPRNAERLGLGLLADSRGALSAVSGNIRRILAVRRSIKKHSSSVAISLGNKNNIIMLIALSFVRCRKIISERADPEIESIGLIWRLLRRLVYRFADLHVSQSNFVTDWLGSRIPRLKCIVIGNSIPSMDASWYPEAHGIEANESQTNLLAIGRLTDEKGFDILLDAMAIAVARFKEPARLEIYGDGPELEKLLYQKGRLGLDHIVFFRGVTQEISAAYRAADVFVLPSRFEGFPNVLIEAMSHGLPIVAARCSGGVADILGPHPHSIGFSFPPNCTTKLAESLVEIVNDKELRETMAIFSRERSSDYSEAKISAAWMKAVEES